MIEEKSQADHLREQKSIRFIDSRYNELFRIPDGGTIRVDYPDYHYTAKCQYLDDYHTQVGNRVYHICQFAELLERGGGTCRPEPEIAREKSVRDIVAIQENGAVSCYYGDSTRFQEIPSQLSENYLKNAELLLEDDYGMIDGVINNGVEEQTQKVLDHGKEKASVVELLKSHPKSEPERKAFTRYPKQER